MLYLSMPSGVNRMSGAARTGSGSVLMMVVRCLPGPNRARGGLPFGAAHFFTGDAESCVLPIGIRDGAGLVRG